MTRPQTAVLPRRAAIRGLVPQGVERLYALRPAELWKYFKSESGAFWLICLYLFFEYVRPQQIYPSLAGYGVVRWTILACTAAFLAEGKGRKWNLADFGLVIYSAIVLSSCFTAYDPGAAFDKIDVYLTWVLVYVLISTIVTSERRFFFFMLTYIFWCFKMSQHGVRTWAMAGFGFVDWGTTCAPGWFHNSGECGIQMAMFAPLALFFFLALRAHWGKGLRWFMATLPASAVMTIVASSSRGALLALAGVALWMLAKSRRYFFRTVLGLSAAFALVYTIIPPEQLDRFRHMGDDTTSQNRLRYWEYGREIIREHPVTGIGYENWLTYMEHQLHRGTQLPHNIFIQAGAELGIPGMLMFIVLIVITLVINRRTRNILKPLGKRGTFLTMMAHGLDCALIGFVLGGYFVTVLYYPFFWINLAMTVALYHTALNVARLAPLEAHAAPAAPARTGPPLRASVVRPQRLL